MKFVPGCKTHSSSTTHSCLNLLTYPAAAFLMLNFACLLTFVVSSRCFTPIFRANDSRRPRVALKSPHYKEGLYSASISPKHSTRSGVKSSLKP